MFNIVQNIVCNIVFIIVYGICECCLILSTLLFQYCLIFLQNIVQNCCSNLRQHCSSHCLVFNIAKFEDATFDFTKWDIYNKSMTAPFRWILSDSLKIHCLRFSTTLLLRIWYCWTPTAVRRRSSRIWSLHGRSAQAWSWRVLYWTNYGNFTRLWWSPRLSSGPQKRKRTIVARHSLLCRFLLLLLPLQVLLLQRQFLLLPVKMRVLLYNTGPSEEGRCSKQASSSSGGHWIRWSWAQTRNNGRWTWRACTRTRARNRKLHQGTGGPGWPGPSHTKFDTWPLGWSPPEQRGN